MVFSSFFPSFVSSSRDKKLGSEGTKTPHLPAKNLIKASPPNANEELIRLILPSQLNRDITDYALF